MEFIYDTFAILQRWNKNVNLYHAGNYGFKSLPLHLFILTKILEYYPSFLSMVSNENEVIDLKIRY